MRSDEFISTGFGIGRLPAPGTMASLFTLALFVGFGYHLLVLFVLTVLSLGGASVAYKPAVKIWGADPSHFILDEFIGQSVALVPVVWVHAHQPDHALWFAIGVFVIFRLFDVTKILGIKHVQKLPGLTGVIGDDLLSAVYTIIIQVIVIFVMF
jgi:phosphatidylglycerophosphatase A